MPNTHKHAQIRKKALYSVTGTGEQMAHLASGSQEK